mmetsp:Transcript_78764/g.218932  ORF Transcript_78764/g.218932 Transcript_78764/m.218932 type:complete len:246 (-) Transcript_78764:712-1449(-)
MSAISASAFASKYTPIHPSKEFLMRPLSVPPVMFARSFLAFSFFSCMNLFTALSASFTVSSISLFFRYSTRNCDQAWKPRDFRVMSLLPFIRAITFFVFSAWDVCMLLIFAFNSSTWPALFLTSLSYSTTSFQSLNASSFTSCSLLSPFFSIMPRTPLDCSALNWTSLREDDSICSSNSLRISFSVRIALAWFDQPLKTDTLIASVFAPTNAMRNPLVFSLSACRKVPNCCCADASFLCAFIASS